MKLHSDTLTITDVRQAFADAHLLDGADIYIQDERSCGSRSRRNGVEFFAYSWGGKYATGHAPIGSYPARDLDRAAPWDAYGWVMARLFAQDPDAKIGWYDGKADFIGKVRQANRPEPKDFLRLVEDCCETCEGTD